MASVGRLAFGGDADGGAAARRSLALSGRPWMCGHRWHDWVDGRRCALCGCGSGGTRCKACGEDLRLRAARRCRVAPAGTLAVVRRRAIGLIRARGRALRVAPARRRWRSASWRRFAALKTLKPGSSKPTRPPCLRAGRARAKRWTPARAGAAARPASAASRASRCRFLRPSTGANDSQRSLPAPGRRQRVPAEALEPVIARRTPCSSRTQRAATHPPLRRSPVSHMRALNRSIRPRFGAICMCSGEQPHSRLKDVLRQPRQRPPRVSASLPSASFHLRRTSTAIQIVPSIELGPGLPRASRGNDGQTMPTIAN